MDYIFDAFSAWNSFGLFLIAFVFTAIGGGITAYCLYWLIKAKTIKGRVKGIMVTGIRKSQNSEKEQQDWKQSKRKEPEKSWSEDLKDGMKKEPVATTFGTLIALLFVLMPLAFAGFGAYKGYQYYDLKASGEYVKAKVIRNDSSYDSESGTTYKAVLSFTDHAGRRQEVKDSISYGNSPSFSTGTIIGVYYNPDDPQDFVIDDFWHNMAISLAFMGFGFLFIGIIVLVAIFGKKGNKKTYKSGKKRKERYAQETYYPVYEYRAPNGETIEQISSVGSNGFLGALPGETVKLKMMPRPPYTAKKFSPAFLMFGLIFLIPGLFAGTQAIKTFEFNLFTILIPLAILAIIAVKILGAISRIPPDARKEIGDFIKGRMRGDPLPDGEKFKITSSSNKKGPKRFLEKDEIEIRLKSQAKVQRIIGYVTITLAIGAFIGAYYASEHMKSYMKDGLATRGEVVNIESRYDSSLDSSGYTYYAVVEFTDQDGQIIKFTDSVGSSHPMQNRGDQVDVIYLPNNPQKAIIDRGVMNWALSGGIALFACLLLYSSFYSFRYANKYSGNISRYRKRV
tara:strand:- start:703 stop:2400 length:1698 start_codon:yes stop_codon:yes gene_type:complete